MADAFAESKRMQAYIAQSQRMRAYIAQQARDLARQHWAQAQIEGRELHVPLELHVLREAAQILHGIAAELDMEADFKWPGHRQPGGRSEG